MSNFVKELSVQPTTSPKRTVKRNPAWEDVVEAISGLDSGINRFIELSNMENDNSVMTVYGNAGAYHISIIENETEQSWLRFGVSDESRVEIAGHLFPRNQICENGELAQRLVSAYFHSGIKSSEANWYILDLEQ